MQKMCEEYIPELQHMPMFYGIDQNEMKSMLTCLGSYIKEYKKEQYIYLCEDDIDAVGIILEGKVHMIRDDLWGNKTLLVSMKSGELFVLFLPE